MKRRLLVLLVGSMWAGCGGAEDGVGVEVEAAANDRGQKIIGGTPTEGDPAIVASLAQVPGADGAALCTASVIAPTVLLLAAHCVAPSMVGENADYVIALGHDLTQEETAGRFVNVSEVYYDELFDPYDLFNGHDIGVLILHEDDALEEIEPLPIQRESLMDAHVGDPVRIVGYGLSSRFNRNTAGVKRTADVHVNGYDDLFVRTGNLWRNICSGDSGGPVLMEMDGVETIVGVNSFGTIFCLFDSWSTRVDSYLDFIDQFLD